MDKLLERESAPRHPLAAAPALAVQFFLVPLAVVAVAVAVYVGLRSMLADDKGPRDYLTEIQTGGSSRRWPAAYELSRLMSDPAVRADASLGPALIKAFENAKDDYDPRVRRYLALAVGRLGPPLPEQAVRDLTAALQDPDSEARISAIWALGSSGDPAAVANLIPLYQSDDPGIRKMTVYALGALPGDSQTTVLRTALQDPAADVRWNAAVALARHGSHEGVPVLRQMLDRQYVEKAVTREVSQESDDDPVADVMIGGLRAAGALRDDGLKTSIVALSQQDRSMKVREAALEALKEK